MTSPDSSNVEPQMPWDNQTMNRESLSLLVDARARASKIDLKPAPLEKLTLKPLDDLCAMAAAQERQQQALLKKHQELSEKLQKLNVSIEAASVAIANIKEDLSLTSEEYKLAAKPLIKAVKKYSTILDMQISIKKHEIEQIFVATVKFSTKPQAKPVNFIIDLKNRNILDFDAQSVMGAEEAMEFKQQAKTEDGWDLDIVLKKLRECSI